MRSRAAGVLVACLAGLLSIQLVGAPPARAAGPVTAGASTSAAGTTAGTSVVVPKPAGVVDGDILIAQITADGAPSVSAAPAGWSTVVSPLAVGNSARVFAYYRVIPTASAEPASYTWRLSSSVRWNAVMTDFHGVDTTTPFDTVARTRVNTSNSNTVAVPGVTTTTAGAMLVGGVGPNSASVAVTPPTSWTESIESRGGQTAELAYQARPTVGATGTATWRLGSSTTAAGWLRALRPAAGGTPPGPTAPTASFTRSPASGTAPLTVSFTDTSTGSPTSWAWNFGDSGTATTQNPSHTYSTAGTYQVTLTATNAGGSNTSAAQTVTVNPADPGPTAPVASFTRSPASGTVPLTVAFTDTSTGSPTSWAWNFGD
ncbi:PKD domain-containing protein, partial [Blastococcus sp. CT_GayMR19]|uniref:PKD domain-containing protein n=1 Tax=Blastococcus sp. CT_GayMR19 TaxID=2559608 RepID=UPI0010748CAE